MHCEALVVQSEAQSNLGEEPAEISPHPLGFRGMRRGAPCPQHLSGPVPVGGTFWLESPSAGASRSVSPDRQSLRRPLPPFPTPSSLICPILRSQNRILGKYFLCYREPTGQKDGLEGGTGRTGMAEHRKTGAGCVTVAKSWPSLSFPCNQSRQQLRRQWWPWSGVHTPTCVLVSVGPSHLPGWPGRDEGSGRVRLQSRRRARP